MRSHMSEPKIGMYMSGAFSGEPGSTSIDQSSRVFVFHCFSLPFS